MLLGDADRIGREGPSFEPALMPLDVAARFVLAGARPVEGTETVDLRRAHRRVLGAPATASHALPRFDNAAMDGYAVAGPQPVDGYRLVGRAAAGRPFRGMLQPGDALRILTGAAVPAGATAIVMQEHAELSDGSVRCLRPVGEGDNIRRRGEDVGASEIVLHPGILLDARHLALLSALGAPDVGVRRRVRVGVLSIGTELVPPGGTLTEGAIFDSNRAMIHGCLAGPTLLPVDLGIVPDHPAFLSATLRGASRETDLIVTSGGVSGSEEDHVAEAIRRAGGTADRVRIALKPGKPLAFGRIGDALILGLPGNPVAALAAFLMIGRPLVARLAGLPEKRAALQAAVAGFARKAERERTELVPVVVTGCDVHGRPILDLAGPTGAARLRPLAAADGFAVLAPRHDPVQVGERVDFIPIADACVA